MAIGVVDIGGTSIKFGVFESGQKMIALPGKKTPADLAGFYDLLAAKVEQMSRDYGITGVGISAPGAVDQSTGIIGGTSAVPYIHGFNIVAKLRSLFGLPVAIENDANCAALAEVQSGAAKDVRDAVVLVLGTGVGGAVVLDKKIRHGAHLLGGEYGYMLDDNTNIVSENGTIVNALNRYNEGHAETKLASGVELYDLATQGNLGAKVEVYQMLRTIAKTIFNLQYSLDPECVVIAGGISQNPHLLGDLKAAIKDVMGVVKIAPVTPDVRIAQYTAEANLYGAAANYAAELG